MKRSFLLLGLVALFNCSYAQYALPNGATQLNAGVGFSDWGIPVYVGFDHGVHRDISVGGELSYRNYTDNFDNVHYPLHLIGIAANGNYHFNTILEIPRNWDLYAGLSLGVYIWNTPSEYHGSHTTGLGLGAQLGGRYYFNNKWGINLELGGSNVFAGGKFGVTVKF